MLGLTNGNPVRLGPGSMAGAIVDRLHLEPVARFTWMGHTTSEVVERVVIDAHLRPARTPQGKAWVTCDDGQVVVVHYGGTGKVLVTVDPC